MRTRLYGLYRVTTLASGHKRYDRMYPQMSFPKAQAVHYFQDALLAGAFTGDICELRPIPDTYNDHPSYQTRIGS